MNKELGMLLGLHCGDSLGATLEFQNPAKDWQTEILGGGKFNWRKGQATDDTDLMIIVLKAIEKNHKFSFEKCKDGMINWLNTEPIDVGLTTSRAIKLLSINYPLVPRENEQGNGSLMRCAPLALLNRTEGDLMKIVKGQASLTHAHPNCIFADQLFVKLLKLAMTEESILDIYQEAINLTKNHPILHQRITDIPKLKWDQISSTGFVFDGIVCSLWALMSSKNFEDGLIKVINRGGDSDTNGAITGALLGAYYGEQEIPERWLSCLERSFEIREQVLRILS